MRHLPHGTGILGNSGGVAKNGNIPDGILYCVAANVRMTDHRTVAKTKAAAADQAASRCPHVVFRNLLGRDTVSALLEYVSSREREFMPASVRNRGGNEQIDLDIRACLRITDLGPFEARLRARIGDIAPAVLGRLGVLEAAVMPREFEITAYGDGGHFAAHIDTLQMLDAVRILSCIYYFATTPRRFTGGNLRLHGFATRSGPRDPGPQSVEIAPDTDALVVFPSWLRHEVTPVAMRSEAWPDRRFAINCWIHRASP